MNSAYQEHFQDYLNFLASENGQIQQEVLFSALARHLAQNPRQEILDAACGPGWLTKKLAQNYALAQGCDISQELTKIARKQYPGIEFKVADLQQPLPYAGNFFDAVVLNMAGPDITNLQQAYANIFTVLKPGGQLLLAIPNPYYTFPVAVWKRSLLDVLLARKPKLKTRVPYHAAAALPELEREFGKSKIVSHFYTLAEYITKARTAGLTLVHYEELSSEQDSDKFNLTYQLFRYPLILLLEFAKINLEDKETAN